MGGAEVVDFAAMEALALFYEDPSQFDLVIADQTMPELTGMNLASELLKLRPCLPVILFTGHSDSVDEESARAAGIRDYLMKARAGRGGEESAGQ